MFGFERARGRGNVNASWQRDPSRALPHNEDLSLLQTAISPRKRARHEITNEGFNATEAESQRVMDAMTGCGNPRWLLKVSASALRQTTTLVRSSDINPVRCKSFSKFKLMASRKPKLDSDLPPVPRREWTEPEQELAAW